MYKCPICKEKDNAKFELNNKWPTCQKCHYVGPMEVLSRAIFGTETRHIIFPKLSVLNFFDALFKSFSREK